MRTTIEIGVDVNVRRLALLVVAMVLIAACGGTDDGTAAADDAGDAAAETEAAPADAGVETEAAEDDAAGGAGETEAADDEGDGVVDDEAAAGQTVLTAGSSDLGEIVTDGDGNTVYVFDMDEEGVSNCTGDCADAWPPVTGEVSAGDGVDEALLGSTEREDGSVQVTYDGQPLYFYSADQAPGDTNGQGVGDVWWVVGPDGQKITG